MDGEFIEKAGSDAVDGWGHYNMRLNTDFETRLDCDDVGSSLRIDLESFSGLLVRINVFLVREDTVFMVFACDGLVGHI